MTDSDGNAELYCSICCELTHDESDLDGVCCMCYELGARDDIYGARPLSHNEMVSIMSRAIRILTGGVKYTRENA